MVKGAGDDGEVDHEAKDISKYPRYLFKIVTIGGAQVGKTSLMNRYISSTFQDVYTPTIGIDFAMKQQESEDGELVKLQIWDTAGQERFRNITSSYYGGASGILLLYDVTNRETFSSIPEHLDNIRLRAAQNAQIILVGNKADTNNARRQTSFEEGLKFADKEGLPFYETSARDDLGIGEVFTHLIKLLIEQYKISRSQRDEAKKPVAAKSDAGRGGKNTQSKTKSSTCILL